MAGSFVLKHFHLILQLLGLYIQAKHRGVKKMNKNILLLPFDKSNFFIYSRTQIKRKKEYKNIDTNKICWLVLYINQPITLFMLKNKFTFTNTKLLFEPEA